MKYWLFICMVFFSLCSCGDTETSGDELTSKITAVNITSSADESESGILFTGDDIAWFNAKSREIKFTAEKLSLPMYSKIDIKLEDETLFTIAAYIDYSVSRAYDDLVLLYDGGTSKYYLYDNYPDYWSPETTEINRQNRKENWNKFLRQLRKENKLR